MQDDPLRVDAAGRLDLGAVLSAFSQHHVEFVLIGGIAGVLHGSTMTTTDIDAVPAGGRTNGLRLAAALDDLDARLVIHTPNATLIPYDWFAEVTTWTSWRWFRTVTSAGELDIVFAPDAPDGASYDYDTLADNAVVFDLDLDERGVLSAPTASLEDLIASKEAAGREKDSAVLPWLRGLLGRRQQ